MNETAGAAPKQPVTSPSIAPAALLTCALFVTQVVGGVYRGLGRGVPPALGPLGTLLVLLGVAGWFWSYCRAQRISMPMDMGWFLMMAWPIVIPYYIITREGRRGLLRIGLFALTYFAAWATGVAAAVWTRVLFVQ